MDRPDGWVYVVAMNQLRDRWRRSERRRDRAPQLADGAADNTSAVATRLSVREAIATLPARQRQAVVLRYLADLSLADEIEPLRGDVGALHRRQRRRRIASSLVVVLAIVVAVSTIVVLRHRDNGNVRVTGAGSKEVPSVQITHVDVIVVPATPAVQDVLDASRVVRRYARVTRSVRASATSLGPASSLLAPFCALESSDGFAVQAVTSGSDIQQVLARDLAGRATSYDVSYALGYDLRLFLKVGASSAQVESVRAALAADRDISWMRFVSQAQAYEDFKKLFADQPALVQGTKPSDLPVSFTIDLKLGVSVQTATRRYRQLGVVDSVIAGPSLFKPTFLFSPTDRTASACTKP